jgi:2-iminobutanoate/2-iminopropanoate deaminase
VSERESSGRWKKEIVEVSTDRVPATRIRSTAPAVKVGPLLFVTGQSGRHLGGQDNYSDDPAEQARQTMENIKAILEAAGSSLDQVVKRTIYVKDPELYDAMRPVVDGYFPSPVASTTLQTGFLRDKMIEIEVIAVVPESPGG